MENKIISFKAKVDYNDLEKFAKALFEENQRLLIEVASLKEQMDHLEDLLLKSTEHLIIK